MSTPDVPAFSIRTAVRADAAAIHELVRELAVFERMELAMTASVAAFEDTLLGGRVTSREPAGRRRP